LLCGDGRDDGASAFAHQFVKLFADLTSGGGDLYGGSAAVGLCAAHPLDELACFELFQHAGHCTGSDAGTGGQVGDASAFLCDQRPENGALPLAQTSAADLVGTDLAEDAGQALEFVPPLLDLDFVWGLRWHKREDSQYSCMCQANK
jgi:hypothetical protein